MKAWLTAALLASSLVAMPLAADARCAAGWIQGAATVVRDGDTIEVGATAIRLQGVAAPERGTAAGRGATIAMRAMVLGKNLRCELDGSRTHDRCAGICYLDDDDIGEALIRAGLARDCPRFSDGRYAEAEDAASADGAAIRAVYSLPGYCRPR